MGMHLGTLRSRASAVGAALGLAVAGFAAVAPTHVLAGDGYSQYCFDNPVINPNGDDIPILTGEGGLWLGVEIGGPPTQLNQGNVGHLAVCLSSTAPGSSSPETFGENISVNSLATGWNYPSLLDVRCIPDPTANPTLNPACQVQTQPSAAISGTTITVVIPYTVCPGPCTQQALTVGETGVVVGTLAPVNEPGIGVGYELVNTQIWVDGIELTETVGPVGAFVDPSSVHEGVAPGTPTQGAPCVGSVCGPVFFLAFENQPILGVQVPGLGSVTVSPPPQAQGCLVQNPNGACPG